MNGEGEEGKTPFPRCLTSTIVADGEDSVSPLSWEGHRSLSDSEVDSLAKEIGQQVKLRGPFLSVSDFVNRRLSDDVRVRYGTIQQAIEIVGLNSSFGDYKTDLTPLNWGTLKQDMKAPYLAAGAPGYLQQADILQPLGPLLSARSDTFRVRAYGSSRDSSGEVKAEAYCEAIVQREPSPIEPDAFGINTSKDSSYGRRFKVVQFNG